MRELLSDQREMECEEQWQTLNLPETKIKWSHVNGNDRMDCVKENEVVLQIIDALIMLNSVGNNQSMMNICDERICIDHHDHHDHHDRQ